MLLDIRSALSDVITESLKDFFATAGQVPGVDVESPGDKQHGDFSTNIALKSARVLQRPPVELADAFSQAIRNRIQSLPDLKEKISRVEVKKPGFINFYLSPQSTFFLLSQILNLKDSFGRLQIGEGRKIQIEFVSANPTGPLSVAHARQAAVGDALGNILNFVGFSVSREYYVNDEGNQINILGKSIQLRAMERLGKSIAFPEDGYQGDYIRDMGAEFLRKRGIKDGQELEKIPAEEFSRYGVEYLMNVIKQELDDFGVHFDTWSHQSKIATTDHIENLLTDLKGKGFLYESEGALWFKSTTYGDDKDRVLKKSDGNYTYFAPDIVYHQDKFSRGFEKVVNIWGPDHHGYIPRLTAAVQALGKGKEAIQVLIVQLATISRNGNPLQMSTRRGQYISLREVMTEVGVDAARYFFLMRHIEAHLDFDLELAKKETAENPVYYIQYAHARIYSVVDKAREMGLFYKPADRFEWLKEPEEVELIKKLGMFPEMLVMCSRQMDPFPLVIYLHELAICFHRFYDRHRVIDSENPLLSAERLSLLEATRIVLANGLTLLGISRPRKM